jgi:hypothetical protein
MVEEYTTEFGRFRFFKLWLILFPILNVIDIAQTWFFFEHEANPLYLLFPDLIFGVKIFWSCFAPLFLCVSYSKKPKIVYSATLGLILLYVGIVLVNTFNILRIVNS